VQTESKDVISLQSHAFQIRSEIKVLRRRNATSSLVQRALFATLQHGGTFLRFEKAPRANWMWPLLHISVKCTKAGFSDLTFPPFLFWFGLESCGVERNLVRANRPQFYKFKLQIFINKLLYTANHRLLKLVFLAQISEIRYTVQADLVDYYN
jgi:hypothetical protein